MSRLVDYKERYFKCLNCGQTVQGWNASQDINCCVSKDMHEMLDPETDEIWGEHLVKTRQFVKRRLK